MSARLGRVRLALAALAVAYALWPLFRSPDLGWPLAPARRLGLFVVLAGLVPYAFRRREGRRLDAADLILLVASPLYVLAIGNGALLGSGDNLATRALGAAIVQRGTLDVSAYPPFDRPPLPYAALRVGGRLLPAFPIGTGLLTVPYAAAAVTAARGRVDEALLARWEKHAAALFGAAATLLFFAAVRKRHGTRTAAAATATFALATPFLSAVPQALWSATGEVLLTCATLALVLPEEASPPRHALGGLAMGAAFLCRPTALLPALAIAAALAPRGRRAAAYLLACGAAVAASCAWMIALYGNPLGGYGLLNLRADAWRFTPAALAGVLASPSRGLLVFCPWLLLIPFLLRRGAGGTRWAACGLAGTAALVLLAAGYAKWWGGHSLGPRLLAEAAPLLALAAVPLWEAPSPAPRGVRAAFAAALAFAAATQLLLVYRAGAAAWNDAPEIDAHPERLWSVRDSQLAAAWSP